MAMSQNYMRQQSMGRGGPSGLADVLTVLLDKGLVIDAFVRVSLVGIELLTIDARIVVASVDTYLRFAEAVNRLDLLQPGQQPATLPDVMKGGMQSGAKEKTKGALQGAGEKISETFGRNKDKESANSDRG